MTRVGQKSFGNPKELTCLLYCQRSHFVLVSPLTFQTELREPCGLNDFLTLPTSTLLLSPHKSSSQTCARFPMGTKLSRWFSESDSSAVPGRGNVWRFRKGRCAPRIALQSVLMECRWYFYSAFEDILKYLQRSSNHRYLQFFV